MHFQVIEEYPKYSISNSGVVKNRQTGRILKLFKNPQGYFTLRLFKNNKAKTLTVHSLVAATFLGKRPFKMEVNHKDGIKTNNNIENLEYVTRSGNAKHMYQMGLCQPKRGSLCGMSKLTEEDVIRIRSTEFDGLYHKEVAEIFGVKKSIIGDIKNRKRWGHL